MSVVIKTSEMQYRDGSGAYHGINAIAEKKIADQEAALDAKIASTQAAVDSLEAQKNTIAATIASMAQLGTDTTLTTPGMAADAKTAGDEISDLKSALDGTGVLLPVWEHGRFNTAGTSKVSATNRIRTKEKVSVIPGSVIVVYVAENYQGALFEYTDNTVGTKTDLSAGKTTITLGNSTNLINIQINQSPLPPSSTVVDVAKESQNFHAFLQNGSVYSLVANTDKTLTVSNWPADAKTTGDEIAKRIFAKSTSEYVSEGTVTLSDVKNDGFYLFSSGVTATDSPDGVTYASMGLIVECFSPSRYGTGKFTRQTIFDGGTIQGNLGKNVYTRSSDVNGNYGAWVRLDNVTAPAPTPSTTGIMQVTISGTNMYVRYSYDDTYDLITLWGLQSNSATVNNNSRMMYTYKALKTLDLESAVSSENQIQYWRDSENPMFNLPTYTWWHIFANHGYLVPVVTSANHGKTSDDYQSVWVDQANREYTLIGVSGNRIFFAPKVTIAEDNRNTRSWNNSNTISELTHVSGAVHTDSITPTSTGVEQLLPLTKTFGEHKIVLDGQTISADGTYYGDCLEIIETLACYDPATIPFTQLYPNIDVTGAEVMCYMTNAFTVVEGSITYRNNLDVRRPIYFGNTGGWGSNQGIQPIAQGSYNAYGFFPRSKSEDTPVIRQTSDSDIDFLINTTYLRDVSKPVDRVVTYVYDPNQDDYKFGFASGLSLIRGDSVDEKRVVTVGSNGLCLKWNTSGHKGYFQILRGTHYENGLLPVGSFFEVVSYFVHWNPDKNPGQQVYWYKDGNSWVVYAHCQSEKQFAQINLPDYMEGLTATVIDKTDGAELLSSVVMSSHLNCRYISAGETLLKNWIVIELK